MNAARGNRIDRQRRVAELNSVRRDTIAAEIGRRVDGAHRRDQLDVAAILHQAGTLDQPQKAFRHGRRRARIEASQDPRRRACCSCRRAAERPNTRRPRPLRSAAWSAGLLRANSRRPPAWTAPVLRLTARETPRRPPASATKSASSCFEVAVGVDGQIAISRRPRLVRARARVDEPAPRRPARAPASADRTRRGRPAGPLRPGPHAISVRPAHFTQTPLTPGKPAASIVSCMSAARSRVMTPGLRDSPRCCARKALPLDQMDLMSELGHSRSEVLPAGPAPMTQTSAMGRSRQAEPLPSPARTTA